MEAGIQRRQAESVAMDMRNPFIDGTKAYMPEANRKVTFDPYHVTPRCGC